MLSLRTDASSTTVFVSAIFHYEHPRVAPDDEAGNRAGSRALLCYAIVALATGTLLPQVQAVGRWPSVLGSDRRSIRALRWVLRYVTDRNLWTASQLLFAVLMVSTFFVRTVAGATVIVGMVGIWCVRDSAVDAKLMMFSWSITCWIPFSMIGEQVRLLQDEERASRGVESQAEIYKSSPAGSMNRTNTRRAATECAPLLGRRQASYAIGIDGEPIERPSEHVGGTTLGIHNIAIVRAYRALRTSQLTFLQVLPQFLTSVVAACIFSLAGPTYDDDGSAPRRHRGPVDSTSWVFLFGAFASLGAAVAVRYIPAPESEERYVFDLVEGVPLPETDAEREDSTEPGPVLVQGADAPRRAARGA